MITKKSIEHLIEIGSLRVGKTRVINESIYLNGYLQALHDILDSDSESVPSSSSSIPENGESPKKENTDGFSSS